jgi:hypothetical protein
MPGVVQGRASLSRLFGVGAGAAAAARSCVDAGAAAALLSEARSVARLLGVSRAFAAVASRLPPARQSLSRSVACPPLAFSAAVAHRPTVQPFSSYL